MIKSSVKNSKNSTDLKSSILDLESLYNYKLKTNKD